MLCVENISDPKQHSRVALTYALNRNWIILQMCIPEWPRWPTFILRMIDSMSKKTFLLSVCVVCTMLLASGCAICTSCEYTYYYFGVESTYQEEYCGSRYEVKNFENDFEQSATQQNVVANCKRQ
jgi:hypothetical protein